MFSTLQNKALNYEWRNYTIIGANYLYVDKNHSVLVLLSQRSAIRILMPSSVVKPLLFSPRPAPNKFFSISYMLYSVLGFVGTFVVGIIVSLLTGKS